MNNYLNYGKKPKHLRNKFEQKPQETLEFKMTESSKPLCSFDLLLNSEQNGKWISGSTILRIYERVFNSTENNSH